MVLGEARTRARGAKTLVTRTYFLTHPREKLDPSQCGKSGTNIRIMFRGGVFTKGVQTREKVIAWAYA
jgi:hypothetical protein